MWNPFAKIKEEKGLNNRIEIEDLVDQGYTCKEIAEELGITEQEVYRIKNARYRRQARIQGKTEADSDRQDRISQLKEELAAVELQDRIDEAKHRAFLRQQERSDMMADDVEDAAESAQENPESLLQTLLVSVLMKNKQSQDPVAATNSPHAVQPGNPGLSPVQPAQDIAASEKSSPGASNPVNFEKIEMGIKTGLISEEKFVQESLQLGLTAEKAKKVFKFIKEKL